VVFGATLAACHGAPGEIDYGTPVVAYDFDASDDAASIGAQASDGAPADAALADSSTLDDTTAEAGDSDSDDVSADAGCGTFTSCPDGCRNLQTDPDHCGSCLKTCGGNNVCRAGVCGCGVANDVQCDGVSVNLSDDVANCGRCGNACAGSCLCGRCLVALVQQSELQPPIAVDSTSVYWIGLDFTDIEMTVNQVPLDGGTSVKLAAGQYIVDSLAVDATNLYLGTQEGPVMSLRLGGTSPTTLTSLYALANDAVALGVDATNVYWAEHGLGVYALPLGVGNAAPVNYGALAQVSAMTTAPSGLYWNDGYTIMHTDPATGVSAVLAQAPSTPNLFAADALDLYWTASGPGDLMALPLVDGGAPNPIAPGAVAVATDGTSVYFGHAPPGSLAKMPAGGGPVTELAWGQGVASIAVDGTSVYWVDALTGSIDKLTPK
jgi:hypothetical protein